MGLTASKASNGEHAQCYTKPSFAWCDFPSRRRLAMARLKGIDAAQQHQKSIIISHLHRAHKATAAHNHPPLTARAAPLKFAKCDFPMRLESRQSHLARSKILFHPCTPYPSTPYPCKSAPPCQGHIPNRSEPFRPGPLAQPIRRLPRHRHRPSRSGNGTGLRKVPDKLGLTARRPTIRARAGLDSVERRKCEWRDGGVRGTRGVVLHPRGYGAWEWV